jgi:uncharacterized protein (TIGR03032 family)
MQQPKTDSPSPAAEAAFAAVHSAGFPALLRELGITLIVSTYQAGKLMAVREADGVLWTLLRSFDRPMGLAVQGDRQLALGTRRQVWVFRNAPDLAPQLQPPGRHDACFVPWLARVTGDILGHEMAWIGDELWIVNTLFSCLCTIHPDYSFLPHWRPPFVTALAPEDRCHLNGFAIVDGRPAYATVLGETDTAEGWRPGKATGGLLVEVPSGAVVARSLSMPHSPRVHAGRLWMLEGGWGQLHVVDPRTGQRERVATLPGFTRGLAFCGPYAFVGLSKIRESAWFGGLPIAAQGHDIRCGIWVVDTRTGQVVDFLEFQSGVEEIFGIEILHGIRFPEILGFQDEVLDRTYLFPS